MQSFLPPENERKLRHSQGTCGRLITEQVLYSLLFSIVLHHPLGNTREDIGRHGQNAFLFPWGLRKEGFVLREGRHRGCGQLKPGGWCSAGIRSLGSSRGHLGGNRQSQGFLQGWLESIAKSGFLPSHSLKPSKKSPKRIGCPLEN